MSPIMQKKSSMQMPQFWFWVLLSGIKGVMKEYSTQCSLQNIAPYAQHMLPLTRIRQFSSYLLMAGYLSIFNLYYSEFCMFSIMIGEPPISSWLISLLSQKFPIPTKVFSNINKHCRRAFHFHYCIFVSIVVLSSIFYF